MLKPCCYNFFYLCISNYQLSSLLSGYKFCYMFLCTCIYKISKFTQHLYQFCQTTKANMFEHIRFVKSHMAVTTSGNISN